MSTKEKRARADAAVDSNVRKRIYWRSDDGIEHGILKSEKGRGQFEVYSYSTGAFLLVREKDIQKIVTEAL